MSDYDVLIIGGGQAGLAMGYYVQQQKRRFLILDSNSQTGDSWRDRYDSLVLFTPRRYSDLPGLPFPGERDGLPTKDDVADYLLEYARLFLLPIRHDTAVLRVEKQDSLYLVHTREKTLRARNVIVATGPFHTPNIPSIHAQLDPDVVQIHTAAYKNEQQLQDGPVLVVGGGNSGAQIAVELAATRPVVLSMGQVRSFLPLHVWGKSIFWYLHRSGLLTLPGTTWIGKRWRQKPDPIFGYRSEILHLRQTNRLRLVERTVSFSGTTATFADGSQTAIRNVIWATGFLSDYSWLKVPGVLDEQGRPIHQRGVTASAGLFFLGLPWQHSRSSALLGGVGNDAKYLAELP